jgi:hypothetical protein
MIINLFMSPGKVSKTRLYQFKALMKPQDLIFAGLCPKFGLSKKKGFPLILETPVFAAFIWWGYRI